MFETFKSLIRSKFFFAGCAVMTLFASQQLVVANRSPQLTPSQFEKSLTAQVQTETGAPRAGRDPATQQQASLTYAASQPTGNGTRTDTPAKNIVGGQAPVSASDVLPKTHKTHVLSSGCKVVANMPSGTCVPSAQ
ncbi:hypothetical protein H7Y63_00415 [Polaromonas sp.]|nr:hypothetical protein [Candidatus Saccharibacteria bacterium]